MDAPLKIKEPKGLTDYILRNCAKETYLIFDRKIDLCVCTRCQTKKKISRMNDGDYLKHNEKHFCYECRADATCKEYRYGRKNITDYGRILFLTKRGRTTYAQLDEYIISYDKLMIPSVSTWTSAQYKFNQKEQLGYKHQAYFDDRWTQMKNIKIPALPEGMYGYGNKFDDTYLYVPSTYGTDLKYANLDMKRFDAGRLEEAEYIISYISLFLKYQSIELLEKSGFERIVGSRIRNGRGTKYINWRGKTLRKILKMNNAEIREARKLKVSINDLHYIHESRMYFPGHNIEELITLGKKLGYNWERNRKDIEKYIPVPKVADYLLRQQNMNFADYRDYLHDCDKLGMNMKNKKVLFPDDLIKAHAETSMKIKLESDKLLETNFKRFEKEITSMDESYLYGEYLIRPAESPAELHVESQVLHHCVRTYVNKVADGQTSILFIRKQEEPDKPLFTLELNKDRKIVQCRGLKNCSYPPDVAEFIKHWEKDVLKKIV